MIETIMIFALGFLTAALFALVILPALNARAERLARRRVEAQFPLSISELTAEKDHLRAEFAVLQRRLERKAEEALSEKHRDMEELGRRALRIEALENDLIARDQRIVELENELAGTRARLEAAEAAGAAATEALGTTRDTAGAVETAHRQTLDELAATRARADAANADLAATRTALATAEERLAARDAAYAEIERLRATTSGDLDARRITISDLETRLSTQTARADEFERLAHERRQELATERQRLSDLAKSLVSEQERGIALEKRALTIEAELRTARERLEAGAPGRDATERELARLREELAAARGGADKTSEILAENAELRRRIDEVAEDILRFAESESAPKPASRAAP